MSRFGSGPGEREPSDETSGAVGRALADLRQGEVGALDRLIPLLYEDLRRMARARLRGERDGHTLDTTALVHEAYLRLTSQRQLRPDDRAAFFAAASNTMRRILVDYARARQRIKRGAGDVAVPIDDVAPFLSDRAAEEAIHFDQALDRLARALPRAASVFEQRFFGGLALEQIGAALGVSTKTVHRDWEAARAWLRKEVASDMAPS